MKLRLLNFSIVLVLVTLLMSSPFNTTQATLDIGDYNSIQPNQTGSILFVHAIDPTWLQEMMDVLTAQGHTVNSYAASGSTPTLADLSPYSVVIALTDGNAADPNAAGDALADYATNGGNLILWGFSFYNSPGYEYGYTGRLISNGVSPFQNSSNPNPYSYGIFTGPGSHSALQNVNLFSSNYVDGSILLASGAQLIASYDNGLNFIAEKGNVLAINGYPGTGFTGDRDALLISTVNYMLPTDILVLHSDLVSASSIQSALTSEGHVVDKLDISTYVPTMAELSNYEIIIGVTNARLTYPNLLGDVLADYVMNQGKLIIWQFGLYPTDYAFSGNLTRYNLLPFTLGDNPYSIGTYPGSSLHQAVKSVSFFNSSYTDTGIVLTPGSYAIASFSEGHPFIGHKQNVLAINAFPRNGYFGDITQLFISTVNFMHSVNPTLNYAPVFLDGVSEYSMSEGSTGNILSWMFFDTSPSNTLIYIDGDLMYNAIWEAYVPISLSLDGFMIGTYNVTIIAIDTGGLSVAYTSIVSVFDVSDPYFYEVPVDIVFEEGSTGNELRWQTYDNNPGTYEIYIDNIFNSDGNWIANEYIVLNVDDLTVGDHTVIITFYDIAGNYINDTVYITVTAVVTPPPSTTPPSSTTPIPSTTPPSSTTPQISSDPPHEESSSQPSLPLPFSSNWIIGLSLFLVALTIRKVRK